MSEFDATSKVKAEEYGLAKHPTCKYPRGSGSSVIQESIDDFNAGRLSAKECLAVACRALEGFQLGHEHSAGVTHIRVMGDTYGWCDYCQTKVSFGPGDAEQAIAAIKAAGNWPLEVEK